MKVYLTYQELTNGKFYVEMQAPEDFVAVYPFTIKQIPEGTEVPRFNWTIGEWENGSAKEAKLQAEQAIAEKEEAVQEKEVAIAEKKTIEQQLLNTLTTVTEALQDDDIPQEIKDKLLGLYEPWTVDKEYKTGDITLYGNVIYRYHATNTTVSTEQLNPKDAAYLWTPLNINAEGIQVWKMPEGYQDAYKKGDIVLYSDGEQYESLIDGNAQEPTKDEPHNRYWEKIVK